MEEDTFLEYQRVSREESERAEVSTIVTAQEQEKCKTADSSLQTGRLAHVQSDSFAHECDKGRRGGRWRL